MTSPKSSSSTQPIPISSSSPAHTSSTGTAAATEIGRPFTRDPFRDNKSLSPFTLDPSLEASPSPAATTGISPTATATASASATGACTAAVEVPAQFIPRARENSQIQLDVFHHPAELHTPSHERHDPMDISSTYSSPQQIRNAGKSPRIITGSPQIGSGVFDSARSPVLAIHHTRGPSAFPEEEDEGVTRTMSGLSLNNNLVGESPNRRGGSVTSETTYVPMTPLPNNCVLSFFDRPREMMQLIAKNPELFKLIEHAVPGEKYEELLMLWKTPRDAIPDEEWVQRTRGFIAMGPDEDEGGALWTRWRELVGWDPDVSSEEEGEDDWNYQPQDTTLHRRWSELERIRQEESATQAGMYGNHGPGSYGSGIGLSGVGVGLQEITEDEDEEEFEDGERPIAIRGRSKKS
jgi:hypothetical protein